MVGELCPEENAEEESSDDDNEQWPAPSKQPKLDPEDRLRGGHKRYFLGLSRHILQKPMCKGHAGFAAKLDEGRTRVIISCTVVWPYAPFRASVLTTQRPTTERWVCSAWVVKCPYQGAAAEMLPKMIHDPTYSNQNGHRKDTRCYCVHCGVALCVFLLSYLPHKDPLLKDGCTLGVLGMSHKTPFCSQNGHRKDAQCYCVHCDVAFCVFLFLYLPHKDPLLKDVCKRGVLGMGHKTPFSSRNGRRKDTRCYCVHCGVALCVFLVLYLPHKDPLPKDVCTLSVLGMGHKTPFCSQNGRRKDTWCYCVHFGVALVVFCFCIYHTKTHY